MEKKEVTQQTESAPVEQIEAIFGTINAHSKATHDNEVEAAKKEAQARHDQDEQDATAEAERQRRARVLAYRCEKRREATRVMCIRGFVVCALCVALWEVASARLIAPQIVPWCLMAIVSWLSYCLGAWAQAMEYWR